MISLVFLFSRQIYDFTQMCVGRILYLDKVKVLQKKIVRIICGVGKRKNSQVLFHKKRLMKFTDLVDFKIAVIMFKSRRRLLPPNIQDRFINKLEGRSCSLRNKMISKMYIQELH